jgi:type I restriction enzyme S subunit
MNSPLAAPLSTAHCPLSTLGSPPIPPGYKQTDVGVIPEEWEVVSVGSLASFTSGSGISVAELSKQSSDTPVPVFGGNGIAGYTFRSLVHDPVVVIGRVGQKCGEVYITDGPAWITDNALYPRTIRRNLDVRFLAMALKVAGLNDVKNRNDLPLVTQSILHAVHIPWPPDPVEQLAIAEALSDMDALLGGLDRLIAKKRDLKQATMQQLLTPPRAGHAGQTRLPGFKGEWEVKRLGAIGKCLRGVSYQGDSDLSNHDTTRTKRLLRSNNVQNAVIVTDDVQFVNAARVTSLQVLEKDDVLICMANGSKALVGKSGLFRVIDGYEYTFGAFMGCFRTNPNETNPSFVFYLFQTGRYRDYINNLLAGSSINNLRPSSIESLEFPIPPLPEQTAIAGVLSDMDTELAALEQRREKTRALKQGMMQELLTGRIRLGAGGEQKGKMRHIEEMGRIKHGAPVSHKARGGAA